MLKNKCVDEWNLFIYLFITFTKEVKRQPALGCDLVASDT